MQSRSKGGIGVYSKMTLQWGSTGLRAELGFTFQCSIIAQGRASGGVVSTVTIRYSNTLLLTQRQCKVKPMLTVLMFTFSFTFHR